MSAPYENSVILNVSGPDAIIGVDRNPWSPFIGTIYAVSGGQANFTVQRSLDGGRTFGNASVVDSCRASNGSCATYLPDIAVGSGGIVYVAAGSEVFRSTDRGVSWQLAANFLDPGASTAPGTEPRTSVTTDDGTGTVYVAEVNASGTVLVARSVDGGLTWTRPIAVAGGAAPSVPQIAAFRDDVLVAFLASANASCGCGYVSVGTSHDGGDTWPNVTAISSPSVSDESAPSLTVSPAGLFAVSWDYALASGTGVTLVSVSSDLGVSFSPPVEAGRYPGIPGTGLGDALVFDSHSRLYVAWQSHEPTATSGILGGSVYVGSAANPGQNFTNASFGVTLEAGGAGGSSYEHLAPGLDGYVYLTWYDFSVGRALFRGVSGEASGDVVPVSQLPSGAATLVELVDEATEALQARAAWTGSSLWFGELPPSTYEVRVRVGNASAVAGTIPVRTWNSTAFTLRVESIPPGPGTPPVPVTAGAMAGGVVLAGAVVLVTLQHTRIAREQVLQRKVRLLIYEAIKEDPGSSFTEVRDAVGLQNGVAAYHLRVLEKQGLIHTEKGRRHRWYYPNGDVSLWRDLPMSPLQRSLVDHVRQAPGIGIRELARNVSRHHASVAYNVKGLVRDGVLRTQREGRKVQCFPMDESDPS